MRELALFAGGAGGLLGSNIIGFSTKCAVEINPNCIDTLLQRQKEGCLPVFAIWDDVRTFDGSYWKGNIDVVTGGFPCTDISAAGQGGGITGENSRLFFEMLRIIEEVRPIFVFSENSPQLRTKGLGAVLSGLASLGYDARWGVLGARDLGANHHRKRMWIVAADSKGKQVGFRGQSRKHRAMESISEMAVKSSDARIIGERSRDLSGGTKAQISDVESKTSGCLEERNHSDADGEALREQPGRCSGKELEKETVTRVTDWWDIPRFARVDDGGPNRLDLERAVTKMEMDGVAEKPRDRNARVVMTGNMQIPIVAATAWRILTDEND